MKSKNKNNIILLFLCLSFTACSPQSKKLILLQTSDIHSRVEPINQEGDRNYNMGGFVRLVTFAKEFRNANPDVLLFDCGDISQGTPYYNKFRGEVEIKMMNEMKYDAMTIGNHEFDFNLDNMERLFRMADFPVVCSNYDVSATVLKDLVKPYVVIERGGVKVGVLGLGCKLEGMVQADKCIGVVYKDPVTTANEVAATLKEKEGCDIVVCLSHLGVQEDEDQLIPKTRNIDVVLGGHTHTFMKGPKTILNMDGQNVSLMHTGKSGIYVGEMDLMLKK
ncbi:metallophosphatase [Bacteroides sp. GD17]|jgi:5'-nucleotidase|uniref:bifunctional metallophosphatase/5'-nucleotidase n=1 Tax=Bacteroides sp. GD17 TaxID=3139826 RepID=UPI00313B831A